jgi:predicted AlkP superfamily phosphohydrolase/phosphomutase
MSNRKKVLVIGLDCATPQFVFDSWRDELPNLKRLMDSGGYGPLKSTIPPITVPAWTCMMCSRDPGQLGIYGFRNRQNHTYDALYFANSSVVKEPLLWDRLGQAGLKSIAIGVPQTYPPKPINGLLVCSFLTPDKSCNYTYPAHIKYEIDRICGGYMIDVENFRTDDKKRLLEQIYEMTAKRFQVVRHYLAPLDWDFFMFVEMGVDRIHHGFWRFSNPEHRLYEPGNPYETAIKDYYIYLDKEIGQLLELLDEQTLVLVVSDHGAKSMQGGIAINEWLRQQGYLKLKQTPHAMTQLKPEMIDWKHTMAWGEGGYYSRIFMNVKGREPEGVIEQADYERIRGELVQALEGICDEKGRNIGTRAFLPEAIYHECLNIPPDLVVYLGNLDWRSIGSIGLDTIHVFENDTGPDDANHAEQGILIMAHMSNVHPGTPKGNKIEGATLYDITPTILTYFDLPVQERMLGEVIGL